MVVVSVVVSRSIQNGREDVEGRNTTVLSKSVTLEFLVNEITK